MIRKFLSVTVFTGTILLASFGQHILGRSDIESWARTVRENGPEQSRVALKKTDAMLAQLIPQAGGPQPGLCDFQNPEGNMKIFY